MMCPYVHVLLFPVTRSPKQHRKTPFLVYPSFLLIPSAAGFPQALSSVNEVEENRLEAIGQRPASRALSQRCYVADQIAKPRVSHVLDKEP